MGLNLNCTKNKSDGIRIYNLKKIDEIKENFSNKNYFRYIDDFHCDGTSNLYVADSGWNKIFKFDSMGKYIGSFGKEGQGPGEFLAQPKSHRLKIIIGNDKNVYVTDSGNQRLSVFSQNGKFIRNFALPKLLYDTAKVNSKGNIYLISKSGKNAIDCYDKNFELIDSFLDIKFHFKYPFFNEPQNKHKFISDRTLYKIITRRDHLIVISNISLTVFHFDEKHNLVNKFMIENKIFKKDFKIRLKEAVKKGGFIAPFRASLDNEENLCLVYYNGSIQRQEMYRYRIDGSFLDILRFPDEIIGVYCIDELGNIYAAINETNIGIYKI